MTQSEIAAKAAGMRAGSEGGNGFRTPKQGRKKRPHAKQVHDARRQVADALPALRSMQLLSRAEIVAITGLSYPTIWDWMRRGKFPRSREVGGRAMWLATEVDAWIAALPVKALKPVGDAEATS